MLPAPTTKPSLARCDHRLSYLDRDGADHGCFRSSGCNTEEKLFGVSFDLIVATVAIFVAIIFGQVEAGLANPYGASRDILNLHSTIGWSLAGILALLTGWRYVARQKDPTALPSGFLVVDLLLAGLVAVQVYLGDKLVWVYGLHTVPVVEAIREGVLS